MSSLASLEIEKHVEEYAALSYALSYNYFLREMLF